MSFVGNLYQKAGIDCGDNKAFDLKQAGGANSGALLLGAGTATSQALTATADKKFVSIYTKSTATSGDSRCVYLRHYIAGAGGSGDCLRAYATIEVASAAGASGAHISLDFGATTYSITGLGVACRTTLHVPNGIIPGGGTYAALQAEIYMDGTSADPRTATEFSLFRMCIAGGNATSRAKVLNLMALSGIPADSGGGQMYSPGTSMGTVTGTLRILIDGAIRYLPVYSHEGHS